MAVLDTTRVLFNNHKYKYGQIFASHGIYHFTARWDK